MNEPVPPMMQLQIRSDGVGVILIDVPGESQNTLKAEFRTTFDTIRAEIESKDLPAVVIASAKEGSFIAGADIKLLETLKSADEGERRSREGQEAFDTLEAWKRPVVAAIHGACLGGGLELALACHARVASDDPKTKLGLPEVQLGLLPGAGGTQRLPALIGLEKALDLLLTGKQVNAKRARSMGLVDEVVPAAILIDVAAKRALDLIDVKQKRHGLVERIAEFAEPKALRELALSGNPAGRKIVFDQAEKTLREKAGEHYPAPYRILEVVRVGLEKGRAAGLALEAKRFGELIDTDVSRRLIGIFFATTAMKKENGTDHPEIEPRKVQKIAVLGAGIMGHGIALVTAEKADIDVRLRDVREEAVARGLAELRRPLDQKVEKKRLSARERDRILARISGTTDYSGFAGADVVIEAVFEDLALKHRVVKEVEAVTKDTTILASNTSSIPITRIAEASSRPDRLIGMHYFSPVHKMPLLEVIRTKDTSDETVATCVDLGRRQGKTVIVVNDGVGFYTSRILGPYMNEASWMLADGIPIEDIDEAARQFGFPVGPITLLDEVGVDTAEKVSHIIHAAFGDRVAPPPGLEKLVADGRTGRKGKKGFYTYGTKKKLVDPEVYRVLGIEPKGRGKVPLAELGERLGLQMVSEAIRCLAEGVLRSPRDGDIGAIFGLGFPPFLGGPFRYADGLGPSELLRRMERCADQHGRRFSPPELLRERAKSGQRFYD